MRLRTLRRIGVCAVAAGAAASLSACQTPQPAPSAAAQPSVQAPRAKVSPSVQPTTPHRVKHVPPVRRVSRGFLGASWRPGCPVPPSQLRAVRISYIDFADRRRVGTIVVNAAVVSPIRRVFRELRHDRFPVRRMRPVTAYGASDSRSVRHDNTSAFNCRYAVAPGPKHWSEHAYGEAVDLDPRENPYLESGSDHRGPFANRSHVRRGMIVEGGPAVRAFDAAGWGWGGRWSAPDYQHFSINGR